MNISKLSIITLFSSCTTLIVSIFQLLCLLEFGAKKLGPSWKILNFKCPAWEKIETHLFLKSGCKGTTFF